ncbi:MAG TPA: protein-methionine-sulfoxide reductase heme-binding subunit MsrQ [Longimicrobium sp.]|jgi:sulfoxide reductase heme-binding subunit YedZ|uniref:sulfite oxidase heme-binding subunit YedZ n=1 Tax=Longimicrobium sp. TaxID=2029185 RepID=UPI002ED9CCBA
MAAPAPWQLQAARWIRPVAWIGGLVPLLLMVLAAFTTGLSADPIKEVTHRTGWAALLMLMLSLSVTPLRALTRWNWLAPVRRTLGLCAYGYAVVHFLIYMVDQGFSWGYITEDILERPYVTVGFAALVILTPLALTSTKGMIRRLGKRWQKLHRLVYVAAGLGVLHFLWLVKKDLREPLIFAAVLAVLLLFRVLPIGKAKKQKRDPPRRAPAPERPAVRG